MEIATLTLTVGNAQRKFLYRKGTVDEVFIIQAMKDSGYNFGHLRRGREISDLYEQLARTDKAPLIVDAGAKIGASAVYFACSFPKAFLVAIEPDRYHFELLTANTADLSVECLHAALASSAEILNAVPTPALSGRPKAADPVTCVTINDIYERNIQTRLPFIVKIDIEDSEDEVFVANTEWVSRTPIIIIELHDCLIPGSKKSRAFIEYIADCNRDFVYLHDNIFSIDRELHVN